MPTSFSQSLMRASVSMRTCRVVVQSSILAFRPSFSGCRRRRPVQPASSRIAASAGSNVAGVWSAKNQPGDVRVGDLDGAAQSRLLISFLSIAKATASRMAVWPSGSLAAILDRRVARAAAGLGFGVERAFRPVRAEELVKQGRDRRDLVAEVLDLRDVVVLEVGREVDLTGLEAGDHEVGVAVPLPDEVVEVGRLAGPRARVALVAGQAQLLLRRDRLELERAAVGRLTTRPGSRRR